MRRGRTLFCGLLLGGMIAGLRLFPPAQAQDDPAPYLYYYSIEQNAFLIERADGSDRRVFAAGEMDSETNAVEGPGWSPSGQWFAWTSTRIVPEQPHTASIPHVLSVDGSRRVSALDAFENAWLQWSPTDDVLLVTGHDRTVLQDATTGQQTVRLYAALIDPAADQVLASWTADQPYERTYDPGDSALLNGAWTSDGQYVVISLSWFGPQQSRSTAFHILDRQGNVTSKSYSDSLITRTSLGQQVIYREGDALVIEDLITSETQTIDAALNADDLGFLLWSPDSHYGAVEANVCGEDASCDKELWLLGLDEGHLKRIGTLSDDFIPLWSPDSRRIVFLDSNNIFHALDVTTGTVTALAGPLLHPSEIWTLEGSWPSATTVVLPGDYHRQENTQDFLIYHFTTSQLSTVATIGSLSPPLLYISADERYAAYVWDATIITDLANGTQRTLAPHSLGHMTVDYGEVTWHPAQDWLIIWDDATIAGGGGSVWIIVANAAGTQRRELSLCWRSDVCANWLPPQVDPADLAPGTTPPPTPEPALTLAGSYWSWLLSWSPDSRRLYSGLSPSEFGLSSLWDVAAGTQLMTLREITWWDEVRWQTDAVGGYLPVIIQHEEPVPDCAHLLTSPDGRQVVTCAGVSDAQTGDVLLEFSEGLDMLWGPPTASYSPDGRYFAACLSGWEMGLYVWDTQTWAVVVKIDGYHTGAAFSPDGTWLAAARSWDIELWKVADLLAAADNEGDG